MNIPMIVLAVGVCIVVPVAALLTSYYLRRLTSQERLKAIEKGVPIPNLVPDRHERMADSRRKGIILIATGLGMLVLTVVLVITEKDPENWAIAGIAAIPIMIGLGMLLEYRLRKKELDTANGRSAQNLQ